jgi:transketolase
VNERHPEFDVAVARKRCKQFRRRILDVSQTVTALHCASAFSCLEVVDCIYFGLMRRAPDGSTPDTFLMSKGHGCMAQYAILEELGVLGPEALGTYCKPGGKLGAHPDYGLPGIEASTGSLGHGLAMAVGMSYADKSLRADRRMYVVMSDGEFQEGSTWEAMMMAANMGLSHLVAFMDLNDFQSLGRTSETHPAFYPVTDKAVAFGWEAVQVNGHDASAVWNAVKSREGRRPMLVVCKTTKGKGVSYMENVPLWHYRSPSPEEYRAAIEQLAEISS